MQLIDQIHVPFAGLNQFQRCLWAQCIVKDNALHAREVFVIPIICVGLQDDVIGTLIERGESFRQLIRPRAPRASTVEDSPALLPPAMLGPKLTAADVHAAELDQRRAIRGGKVEPHRVWIANLQPRPRFEG